MREEDKMVSKNGKVMGRKCFAIPEKVQLMEDCLSMTYGEVADKYGVSRPTIIKWRRHYGLNKGIRNK
jgi:DNA-binding XRE family transcriptional regulator